MPIALGLVNICAPVVPSVYHILGKVMIGSYYFHKLAKFWNALVRLISGVDGSARYAHALCDVAMTAIRMLADEFGEDLRRPLLGVSTRPAFGTLAELSSLLDTCYQGQAQQ